ncbi:MAG: hypothetical protein IT165_04965, partial [Bryobacterales bacterium]|nr:hypothetical protein [Bryobacterales bacterium]
ALAMFRNTTEFFWNTDGTVSMSVLATGAGLMTPLPVDGSLGKGETRVAGNFTAEFVIGTGFLSVARYRLPVTVGSNVAGLVQGVVRLTVDIGNRIIGAGYVYIGVDVIRIF